MIGNIRQRKSEYSWERRKKGEVSSWKRDDKLRLNSTLKIKILFFYLSKSEVTGTIVAYMKETTGKSLFSPFTE